jgi:hypothetical protein
MLTYADVEESRVWYIEESRVWYIEALKLLCACGESSEKEVLSKIDEALSEGDDKFSKTVKRRRESDHRTMQGRFQILEGAHFCFASLALLAQTYEY